MQKNTKKNKFIDTQKTEYNKYAFIDIGKKNYNNENLLLQNNIISKDKTQLILKKNLDPFDYELNYSNNIKKDNKGDSEFIYYSAYDQGPGRGFGNLNINNNIRMGEQSRHETQDFKIFRESETHDRFEFIDNRYNKAENIVFPFPRSGELTRKTTYFNNDVKLSYKNKYNLTEPNINLDQSAQQNNPYKTLSRNQYLKPPTGQDLNSSNQSINQDSSNQYLNQSINQDLSNQYSSNQYSSNQFINSENEQEIDSSIPTGQDSTLLTNQSF